MRISSLISRSRNLLEQLADHAHGGGEIGIQVEGADQGLEARGNDLAVAPALVFFLAAAQQDVAAQAERFGHLEQHLARNQVGAQLGQVALALVAAAAVNGVGDGQADDRIAQELQPLVVQAVVAARPR